MPPIEMFTKDFTKELLPGTRKLLKMTDVKFINVVKYDELSVKNLYDRLIKLEGMAQYFPGKYPLGRFCDRSYMWNVANTLHSDVVKELVQHALKVRHAVDGEGMKEERIMLNDHWEEELNSLPIVKRVGNALRSYIMFRIKDGWWLCSSRSPRLLCRGLPGRRMIPHQYSSSESSNQQMKTRLLEIKQITSRCNSNLKISQSLCQRWSSMEIQRCRRNEIVMVQY